MAQAFLKQNESANTTVSILEGKNLLEPDVKIQNMIPLDLSLVLIACDQLSQTGMNLPCRQQLTIPGPTFVGKVMSLLFNTLSRLS